MRLVDLHDAAFYDWREAGVRDAVLVHIDAHHDTDAKEWDFVTISNFVWWALCERLVREVFWVVPEPNWESASGRSLIRHALEGLVRQHDDHAPVEAYDRAIRVLLGGRPFTACALSTLPPVDDALLSIDVDYLLIPDIAHELPPIEDAMPWMWPDALVAALRAAGVNSSNVTVATSTRGGFVPFEWKYLGEEVCARLCGAPVDGYDALRAGAEAERRSDFTASDARYRDAIRLLPASAGARYRLARLHLLRGNDEEAHRLFEEAVDRDPSYRAADSVAQRWWARGNTSAAKRAYEERRRMEPDGPYAELGLGHLAAASGEHAQAIVHFERSLKRCETLVDAHRGLGTCLEATGDIEGSIRHYERALRLELLGHASLDAPIATRPPRLVDERHWDIHRRLARLQHDRRWSEAVDRVRQSSL